MVPQGKEKKSLLHSTTQKAASATRLAFSPKLVGAAIFVGNTS